MSTALHSPFFLLTDPQIPQTRLVTGRWLVLPTCELEGEYGGDGGRHNWHYGFDVELERGTGDENEVSGSRTILSQSVVRIHSGRKKCCKC